MTGGKGGGTWPNLLRFARASHDPVGSGSETDELESQAQLGRLFSGFCYKKIKGVAPQGR
jgi:hypothetical protein